MHSKCPFSAAKANDVLRSTPPILTSAAQFTSMCTHDVCPRSAAKCRAVFPCLFLAGSNRLFITTESEEYSPCRSAFAAMPLTMCSALIVDFFWLRAPLALTSRTLVHTHSNIADTYTTWASMGPRISVPTKSSNSSNSRTSNASLLTLCKRTSAMLASASATSDSCISPLATTSCRRSINAWAEPAFTHVQNSSKQISPFPSESISFRMLWSAAFEMSILCCLKAASSSLGSIMPSSFLSIASNMC
mmetsp:Transcript_92343/g.247025  ORF Transcript_92343/g.247025 Transcript_92343/m.247025 type:complete len:247 (-) Transcript_92343:1650-2390(-)